MFERVLVNRGDEKLVYSIGKYGILENDRVNGKFRGFKETVFQNAFTHIDPETGEVTYREDIQNAQPTSGLQPAPPALVKMAFHDLPSTRPHHRAAEPDLP